MAEEKTRKTISRRQFLRDAAVLSGAVVGGGILGGLAQEAQTASGQVAVPQPNAKMVVLHDPSRCVGCRRCEVACTLSHDGKIQPTISRVKVSRNFNFGPEAPGLASSKVKVYLATSGSLLIPVCSARIQFPA
jgi:ferredoxin